jgi:release factor glutamine methyltransferase
VTKQSRVTPEQSDAKKLFSVGEVLRDWTENIDQLEARWMLENVLGVNAAFLIAHPEYELTPAQAECFHEMLARRRAGEPVAYLIGERGFYDLTFKVTPDVLIPRPETELLVEMALSKIPSNQFYRVLDLGTGSGAIAITIAIQRPLTEVVAVDSSPRALAVARKNAEMLCVNNITFLEGNWYSGLGSDKAKFGLIVANPPYVAEGDPHLEIGDLRFEPYLALVAPDNGMGHIHEIISHAPAYLDQNGWLLLEHGYNQASACRQLLEKTGFAHIFTKADLAEIDRVSGGKYETAFSQEKF